jgi:hypothetical protein
MIQWEIHYDNILDEDNDERMVVYYAEGTDEKGNLHEGSAYFFCGELDEIKDIQIITIADCDMSTSRD